MTAVETTPEPAAIEAGGAIMERLFMAMLGSLELATVHLGSQLGLYAALAQPRSAGELASATGIDERYAEEWLEQQAIGGLVEVAEPGDRRTRRYVTSRGQRMALAEPDSPVYAASMALLLGGVGAVLPRLPQTYRDGTGISFGEYGDDVRLGQGLFNRIAFLGQLVPEWLPAMPDVAALLARDGAAAVDLGCGVGWSSIALAQAHPALTVLGVDSDDASVMEARLHAADAGLEDRVRFEVVDAAADLGEDSFDVAFYFEALHDMAHPVEALASTGRALRPGGRVVVMDERAEEEFAPDGSEIERLLAASSVLHCLPVGRSQGDSTATGALFRPATMRRYAEQAGYAAVEVAPIEHDVFRFYVLRP
ncbi:class I SAM-dependent methyltransferase [Marmoricola sp. URHB0036]|uniref:class I SAM-dependent methyltransferase n=1 Tax=Marmoricola sp. URHB0036 TaxID=1298863 RepID=UPI0004005A3D|nr:class I SAM-dependent methyltransferase [Marmoricola sp. URHB0036]